MKTLLLLLAITSIAYANKKDVQDALQLRLAYEASLKEAQAQFNECYKKTTGQDRI